METTILVVEDDRLVLHLLARGLSDAGYQILAADSGEMAMQLCSAQQPDLALLDIHLPGISGIEFAQWLKNTLAVPFLFLSAYDDSATVATAAELGALGYLVKPLDVPQVLPTIRTALQRATEIKQLHQAELNLKTALHTSRNISMAIGLLMQRFGSTSDETFDALRAYCRSNRKRMLDVAEQVVEQRQEVDLAPHLRKSKP
ncbi:putative transcriptional regulatory protein pdtaR [Ferriphaselus amnicola]|uniref:Putative transcriptional regulatory protein pdtaR n=1 Tax=Ferriphaselus amnicola TaxID=1188319 RepID=A0A2Z6GCX7_9PROT|nr:response regulator [Ferriphaselus amnicola]BBE51386.1 putative transcriptional regulatory protein pdtaR [Ferriphaselus amnicola]